MECVSTLTLADRIGEQFPHFFHVTLGRFASDIQTYGLCPQRASMHWQDPDYYRTTFGERKPVCLCTATELPRTKYMISNGRNVPQRAPEMIVFQVPASAITRAVFDLDRSFSPIRNAIATTYGNSSAQIDDDRFLDLLVRYGFVVVFKIIAASELIPVPTDFGGFLGR